MLHPLRNLLTLLALSVALGGCVTLARTPFPQADVAQASPPGFTDVRYNQNDPRLASMLRRSMKANGQNEIISLAISGGGANGAYGAGLLYEWTKTGRRPQFQLVTGVSTGALTAPFAFLGPDWDEPMRQAYFGPRVANLLQARGIVGLFSPGFYNKGPLIDLVRSEVTDEMLAAIAAEHAKGRRLLVATTNLDTEEMVVWDMGAIAAHGGPAARNLFVQVMVASASVPGVFPPSLIQVQAGAHRFTELHVDGQAEGAFFAIPQTLLLSKMVQQEHARARLYIIVNGQLDGLFALTPHSSLSILARSLDTANKASIRSMLISTEEFCERSGCDLKVSALPLTAEDDPLDFRAAHISALFAAGGAAASDRNGWNAAPMAPAPAAAPARSVSQR